ncbi:hypothetical protein WICPIJ_002464 [Wickerhamomyces pijperi]|uniref:Uncharacterized protein n=1 Tax=Wickerhamomyces pijperi TaxID=599730 RepID=A0A9P8TPM8_WICPI|nr:hypothetical protein WICPIJ_002464 [Wickerhamomyces pijperi]
MDVVVVVVSLVVQVDLIVHEEGIIDIESNVTWSGGEFDLQVGEIVGGVGQIHEEQREDQIRRQCFVVFDLEVLRGDVQQVGQSQSDHVVMVGEVQLVVEDVVDVVQRVGLDLQRLGDLDQLGLQGQRSLNVDQGDYLLGGVLCGSSLFDDLVQEFEKRQDANKELLELWVRRVDHIDRGQADIDQIFVQVALSAETGTENQLVLVQRPEHLLLQRVLLLFFEFLVQPQRHGLSDGQADDIPRRVSVLVCVQIHTVKVQELDGGNGRVQRDLREHQLQDVVQLVVVQSRISTGG